MGQEGADRRGGCGGAAHFPDGRRLNPRTEVDAALTRVAREEGGRLLALLADRVGGIDRAEDALQDAYARAARSWSEDAVPGNPAAWVYTVARNAGIDRLRRDAAAARRERAQVRLTAGVTGVASDGAPVGAGADVDAATAVAEYSQVGDEQLRLLLLCCHPALSRDAQVALTLRLAGGLTTAEIAAAYLVPEATIAQRLVRAKKKIRAANIPLTVPADLGERAETLATVLGLIFNEGYLAHTADAGALTRSDLANQAVRMTAAAADALPDHPELAGLLALQLFHRSRERARVSPNGELMRLADQDRSLWDRADIARGFTVLGHALAQRALGPWQLQALIAAEHTRDKPDWDRVVRYHDRLQDFGHNPVAALGRVVARAEIAGAAQALRELDDVVGLERYHLFHAARADLLERVGRPDDADASWREAAALAVNPVEAAHIRSRRAAGRSSGDGSRGI